MGQGIHGKVCYVKSTWPGCEVKQVGDLSLSQYHSPWTDVVIANDRWILCGGIPPPMTTRGNGTVIERKPTPGQSRPRSLTTSARRATVYKMTARVWTNRENCKGLVALNAPSYPTASQTAQCPSLSTDKVFFFRWSCNHFQGNKVVDVWSNHAYPRLSGGSVNSFCPGLRKCTPRQRQMAHRVHEPAFDASVISKATKDQSAQFVWLSLDWARNSPYIDKARVRGSCWTFIPKGQSSYQC